MQLVGSELESEELTSWIAEEFDMPHPVDRRMKMDILTYLPGALLPKVDRMTMANSLEGRSPFLDHRLMEFAATLPAELKLKDGQLKYILKQAGLKFFTSEFLNRPKQGFGVPIGQWFRGELKDYIYDMLLGKDSFVLHYFNAEYITILLDEHGQSRQGHEYRIWALLMLEVWARTFLHGTNILDSPAAPGV
jgi:asparagine synthase (glutamine-hydrolysing)